MRGALIKVSLNILSGTRPDRRWRTKYAPTLVSQAPLVMLRGARRNLHTETLDFRKGSEGTEGFRGFRRVSEVPNGFQYPEFRTGGYDRTEVESYGKGWGPCVSTNAGCTTKRTEGMD